MNGVKSLKEKLIFSFGTITLVELLNNEQIYNLVKLHKHCYVITFNTKESVFKKVCQLGFMKNMKNIKVIEWTDISNINLDNSIVVIEYPISKVFDDIIKLKTKYPSSTIIFCKTITILPPHLKNFIDVILFKNVLLNNYNHNDYINIASIRFRYYVNDYVISQYSKFINDDTICIHYDGKIMKLCDLPIHCNLSLTSTVSNDEKYVLKI